MPTTRSSARLSDASIEARFRDVNLRSPPSKRGAMSDDDIPVTPHRRTSTIFRSALYSQDQPPSTPSWSSPRGLGTPYSTVSMSPGTPYTPITPRTPASFLPLASADYGYALRGHQYSDDTPGLGVDLGPQKGATVTRSASYKAELAQELARGRISDGRYLMIHGLPLDTPAAEIKELFTGLAELKAIIIKFLASHGFIFLVFFDPRQAHIVKDTLRDHPIEFSASPEGGSMLMATESSRLNVEHIVGSDDSMRRVWHQADAQILLQVTPVQAAQALPLDLRAAIAQVGDVRSFRVISFEAQTYLAEFFDTRHAAFAHTSLDDTVISGNRLSVIFLSALQGELENRSSVNEMSFADPHPNKSFGIQHPVSLLNLAPDQSRGGRVRSSPIASPSNRPYVPPARRSTHDQLVATVMADPAVVQSSKRSPPLDAQLQKQRDKLGLRRPPLAHKESGTSVTSRCEPSSSDTQGGDEVKTMTQPLPALTSDLTTILSDASQRAWQATIPERQRVPIFNIVDKASVKSGADTRTTVMIKDVPNKLSRQQLVAILDETVPGEFDFVYLRFDFKNRCNVGYAFVNFCSTDALYKFMEAKVGRKWNMFQSEKVLQVSYADIQGKEALIAKFRNSSVMDVQEAWRPQIFHSEGPLKGHEENFPESDDPRMRYRSTAARLIGLYNEPAESLPNKQATATSPSRPPRSRR